MYVLENPFSAYPHLYKAPACRPRILSPSVGLGCPCKLSMVSRLVAFLSAATAASNCHSSHLPTKPNLQFQPSPEGDVAFLFVVGSAQYTKLKWLRHLTVAPKVHCLSIASQEECFSLPFLSLGDQPLAKGAGG